MPRRIASPRGSATSCDPCPACAHVGAHVGRAVTGDQMVGINSSQIWISIDPKADYDKTVAAIRETVDGYPGIDRTACAPTCATR